MIVAITYADPGTEDELKGSTPHASSPTVDRFRPAFHITPAANWMNDPQRPIYVDGLWHFYYLYNADYPSGNGTEWRHLTSVDLVHWIDRGIAIKKYQNGLGDIETGSAVVDTEGAAGHGRDAVIAIVTQQEDGVQRQSMFFSTDGGYHFAADVDNPVMQNPGEKDWRDPKVSWDAQRHRWQMVLSEGRKLGFYTSSDLRAWTYQSGFETRGIGTVECPDLFQIDLNGDPARPVWVLAASASREATGGTTGFAYWTGSFDGSAFTADHPDPQWLDQGADFYAAVTWADPSTSADRYAIAWLNNWSYARSLPTSGWHGGADTVPRTIRLQDHSGRPTLISAPAPAVDSLTQAETDTPPSASSAPVPTTMTTPGTSFMATIDLQMRSESETRFRLQNHSGSFVDLSYDPRTRLLRFTRDNDSFGRSAQADDTYRAPQSAAVTADDGRLRLRILVDALSVEVFAGDGASLTALTFIAGGAHTLEVASGSSNVDRIELLPVTPVPVREEAP